MSDDLTKQLEELKRERRDDMDSITQLFVDYKNEHRVTEKEAKKDSGTMTLEVSDNAILAILLASGLLSTAICLGACCCIQQINKKIKQATALASIRGSEIQQTGSTMGSARSGGQSTDRHMRRLETDAPMAADAALDTEAGNMDDMKE